MTLEPFLDLEPFLAISGHWSHFWNVIEASMTLEPFLAFLLNNLFVLLLLNNLFVGRFSIWKSRGGWVAVPSWILLLYSRYRS